MVKAGEVAVPVPASEPWPVAESQKVLSRPAPSWWRTVCWLLAVPVAGADPKAVPDTVQPSQVPPLKPVR